MQLGKKPERERDPTQARSPRPPRSMTAEAARRPPRPRWTIAGSRHTGQLTRQRSAAALSSRPSGTASTAAQHTATATETATQPCTTCTEDGSTTAPGRPQDAACAALLLYTPITADSPSGRPPRAHAGQLDRQRTTQPTGSTPDTITTRRPPTVQQLNRNRTQ